MPDVRNKQATARKELVRLTQQWASGDSNLHHAQKLRKEVILLNHAHYLEKIHAYRKLASEAGIGKDPNIEDIKKYLTFTDGIFKSYQQEWLDNDNYSAMNRWLSGIFHKPVDTDVVGVKSIDEWAERLKTAEIKLVYSSGTSGNFSFVPREEADWVAARITNIASLAPQLINRLAISAAKLLVKTMLPEVLMGTLAWRGLPDFDSVFLGFRRGRMGNQVLIPELAVMFEQRSYLYDIDVTANVLRALTHGVRNKQEQEQLDKLQNEVVGKKRLTNYQRIIEGIEASTKAGQKVFIFGAPYQFKELCEIAMNTGSRPSLKKGSLILFGGGWKSFSGEAVEREKLAGMISRTFDLPPEMILEGYSMTEISVLMLRCNHGCFHIPPLIEPVIYDDELNPVEGHDISGRFGFLDPLAVSYPGFIISNDLVHIVDSGCKCGLQGPAIISIDRAPGQEVKGCGGIMSSIKA